MFKCGVKKERHGTTLPYFLFMCELNHHLCPSTCLSPLFQHLTFLLRSNMSIRWQWVTIIAFYFRRFFSCFFSTIRTKFIQTLGDYLKNKTTESSFFSSRSHIKNMRSCVSISLLLYDTKDDNDSRLCISY